MSHPTYPQPPADRSVKVPHLVFGLLFLGVAGIWALAASDLISGEGLAILGPGVLIAAGVIGLAASLASGRNRGRASSAYEPTLDDTTIYPSHDTTTQEATDYAVTDAGDDHTEEIR
jgi:hypothetical protein